MSKRKHLNSHPTTHITITSSDLSTSHEILAPNEFSSATIGIHNYLVRCPENEYFSKQFYDTSKPRLATKDFIGLLNDIEKSLSKKCQVDIERCAVITRLYRYLEQNDDVFQNILIEIQKHLIQCMEENPLLPTPQAYDEFRDQCTQRNKDALKRHQAHRMQRFRFYDDIPLEQPMNAIRLQTWILMHFQMLQNIKPHLPTHDQFKVDLNILLNNSFFIIQQPSPPIATLGALGGERVKATINCKILCLLNISDPTITVDSIIPKVYRVKTSNQMEESNVVYQQSPMSWKTYSIITASKNRRNFSCFELSEVVLEQISRASQKKIHYAQVVYRIAFHIDVTVRLPHDPEPHKSNVIVHSSPFGLVTNTSQAADLFADVFIEDLKFCKQTSNITAPLLPTPELILDEILDGIKHYFIYKTGINPKDWVMLSIEAELTSVYSTYKSIFKNPDDFFRKLHRKLNFQSYTAEVVFIKLVLIPGLILDRDQHWTDKRFSNILAKMLAQIDFMAEHPLLILFHEDGLFAFKNIKPMDEILKSIHVKYAKSVCAIRFGSINRMSNSKDVCIRVDFVEKHSTDLQRYTFNSDRLPSELGLFIIKIALYQASRDQNVLSDVSKTSENVYQCVPTNMGKFAELYDSERLRQLCPHEKGYRSIWTNFENKQTNTSEHLDPSQQPTSGPDLETMLDLGANAVNCPYSLVNSNISTNSQLEQRVQVQLQQQYNSQAQVPSEFHESHENFLDISQSPTTFSYTYQTNQGYVSSPPIVIVITPTNQFPMSNEYITQLISKNLPQYSPYIQSDHILRFNVDPLFQSLNAPVHTSENSFQNRQSISTCSDQDTNNESYTTDCPIFPEFNDDHF